MNKITLVNMREVLEQNKVGQFEGWLYLPKTMWDLSTQGLFIMEDLDRDPSEKFPPHLLDPCKLSPMLEASAIEDIIIHAKQKIAHISTEDLLKAFIFYVENDAFLEDY